MNRLITLCWMLGIAIGLLDCQKENCDSPQRLEVTPESTIVVTNQGSGSTNLQVQYPLNCADEPYRGYLTIVLETPDIIPGAEIILEDTNGGGGPALWTNLGETPASGTDRVGLTVRPKVVDGQPAIPTAGTYSVSLRATFDDPDQRFPFVVMVEVISEGFDVVILEPNANTRFFEGQDSVALEALANEQTNGIASLAYRLDNQAWQEQTYSDLPGQATIEQNIYIPAPGNHSLTVRAINGLGETVRDSVSFFIPADPTKLNDHRWDGGGDNLRWEDPLNWEGDRLPNAQDKAIIDLETTPLVLISSDEFSERVYPAGSVDITADIILRNSAVLEISAPQQRPYIRGSVRFEQDAETAPPTIRFGASAENTRFRIRDTLYINRATIASHANTADNRLTLNYTYAENDFSGSTGINLVGPVHMYCEGLTIQRQHVRWSFYTNEGVSEGSPMLTSAGRWIMTNGATFYADPEAPEPAEVISRGGIQVIRELPSASFGIGGHFVWEVTGDWVDAPPSSASGLDGGTIILETTLGDTLNNENPFDPKISKIDRLRTRAHVLVKNGNWEFNVASEMPLITVEQGAFVTFLQNNLGVRRARVEEGGRLDLGGGSLSLLESRGELWVYGAVSADSLRLLGGSFIMGYLFDTARVSTQFMEWLGGNDASSTIGTGYLSIQSNPNGIPSVWAPGTLTGERKWNTHLSLEEGAQLEWRSGLLNSQPYRPFIDLDIAPGATLRIDDSEDKKWGFRRFDDEPVTYVRIRNAGLIQKLGSNRRVDISACMETIGAGRVENGGGLTINETIAECN